MSNQNIKSKYTIGYLIPYFGKLPSSIRLWLLSCKKNPSIDWILLTDDKTEYDYPENVKVHYCSYEDIKSRISSFFDFDIIIDKPWRLSQFKPAYGEIFKDELEGYDFWGHCDMDLLWGDIRHFITDDILEKYDKIGFQGHSTLYRNNPEVNAIYKTEIDGIISYKEVFSGTPQVSFDENVMCDIFDAIGKEYYHETNFAHLELFENSFYLGHLPKEYDYKNNRQVILWKDGKIYRYYNFEGKVYTEEYMYFHTFMRPIKYKIDKVSEDCVYIAYPDVIRSIDEKEITYDFIKKHGTCSAVAFYLRLAYTNRHKLSVKKVVKGFIKKMRWKYSNRQYE